MMMNNLLSLAMIATLTGSGICKSVAPAAHYKAGDRVPSKVSNVVPFYSPTEKYPYYKLPWACKAEHRHKHQEPLGAVIAGEREEDSPYVINFLQSMPNEMLCESQALSARSEFISAVRNEYQYEMWIDDLPVFGRVGFTQQIPDDNGGSHKAYYLITHRHFHIKHRGGQVITVNVSTRLQPGHYIELNKGVAIEKLQFTYGVSWHEEKKVLFSGRWEAQMQANPSRYQIEAHWLWVLNSTLLVVLLTGLLSMILLRTLKNDVARYLQLDQIDQEEMQHARENDMLEEVDDSGWKRVRGDVFRAPEYPFLLSSIVGVGAQMLMIILFLLILAIIGYFYPGNHGRIYVAAIFLYSFTAYVAGYVASAKLKEFATEAHDWMVSCVLTASLFAGPFLMVFAVVNSVAISYQSSIALPFATILAIILLWAFVTFPLTAFGAYRGARAEIEEYPCTVKKIARPIPKDLAWYHNPYLLVVVAGFLPFMAIYVEVHTIFMSVWGHQPYTLFGILLLTFIILLIVTSFVVILMCYFQLTAENHQWIWASVFRGMACGIFMFLYAIYYYNYTASMTGSLQFVMYFGYTLMSAYALSLMLAAVAHWSSRWFVIRIYKAIKSD